ncbi:hypothetical protein [Oscillatoria acuminata]|uniref:Uncharacterized protein n=1 Tax=Oscillatoria acuminata PCC 6304 TaxID=56110 RepID=K9TNK0_9CYAN|nr:hypothetical protein [Oscillatoria acuminata]AFY83973.1 hypothetical protein Oscil6304_4455 [Oscillatoria acuminata PCC 6304]
MAQVQRWYLGYSYRGKPQDMIEKISREVQEQNLSKFLPIVRLEKGAKPRQSFYFFVAIESDNIGTIPQEIEASQLLRLPYFKNPAVRGNSAFTYKQIKNMVGGVHDVFDYTNPIPYQVQKPVIKDSPFDWTGLLTSQPSSQVEECSKRCDRLLYLLSARGCGTWESFRKVCDTLNLDNPKSILRRLKLLGHLESSNDGKRWSVAPPALVEIKSDSESPEFILCGQRSEKLLKQLHQYGEVISKPQPQGNAPACIRVKTKKIDQITQELDLLNPGEVSRQLIERLSDISDWQKSLTPLPGIVVPLYQWKRFDREINDFIECILPNETGMYQIWHSEQTGIAPRTLFYEEDTQTWRQGDWYGLRFLALYHNNSHSIVRYDTMMDCLAIPWNQRSPEIYERALVLASGFLPTYYKNQESGWLIYENIGKDLVQKLVEKLHLTCEED